MPVIPPQDPRDLDRKQSGIELPKWIWAKLVEFGEEEGYSRNEVITFMLKWAISQHEAEKAEKKAKR